MFDSFANLQGIVAGGALFLIALVLIPTVLRSVDSMSTGVMETEYCVASGEPFVHVFKEADWENGQPKSGVTPLEVTEKASDTCELPTGSATGQNYYTPMGQKLEYPTAKQLSGGVWTKQPDIVGRQAGITNTFLKLLPMVFLIGGLVAAVGWLGWNATNKAQQ